MSAASTYFARAVVWFVFSPLDRTVCRWAEITHQGRRSL